MRKTFEITQISDAGIYWLKENLIFPDDENGIKGKLVYQKEMEEYMDQETNGVEINNLSRELEWENGEISLKIEPEE
ncbi:hypothetical protein [Patiriisocius sp. Uisw_047]|uniref:hypothetical protein n=1 Tax=Patiriisocius sp. Uisw_047 TaxID=3230969 RepID=UPI0039EB6602